MNARVKTNKPTPLDIQPDANRYSPFRIQPNTNASLASCMQPNTDECTPFDKQSNYSGCIVYANFLAVKMQFIGIAFRVRSLRKIVN
uniref:Uncharacterized protein n=1 Tax=Steinernema glaseri TaxID=37863 RepID=A0A1I7Y9K3_9BILA